MISLILEALSLMELEINLTRASSIIIRLRKRLWKAHFVTIRVKCQVYNIIILSTLLYGAVKAWTLNRKQVRKPHALQVRHLRSTMSIPKMGVMEGGRLSLQLGNKWDDKVQCTY